MLNHKNILITGGTGSFGKQFTNTILKHYTPTQMIIGIEHFFYSNPITPLKKNIFIESDGNRL